MDKIPLILEKIKQKYNRGIFQLLGGDIDFDEGGVCEEELGFNWVFSFGGLLMATEAASVAASHSWSLSYKGMSSDNIKGLVLALSSSFFIGASFIVKKKGLKKAGASGVRAGTFTNLFCFTL